MDLVRSDFLRASTTVAGVAMAVILAACGGRESTASKSAAAYEEAKSKGVEIGGGHAHGGHAVPDAKASPAGNVSGMDHSQHATGSMAEMDHSQMLSGSMEGMDHSTMQSGSMAGMDHSRMQSGSIAGMDHSQLATGGAAGMDHSQHATESASGTDHSQHTGSMSGMDHSQIQGGMAGMQHGGGTIPPGGLWGPVEGSLAPAGVPAGSTGMAGMDHSNLPGMDPSRMQNPDFGARTPARATTSSGMAAIRPSKTLTGDSLDRAAPGSLMEASKSTGTGHDKGNHP